MVVRELITRLGFKIDTAQLQQAEKGIDRLKVQASGLSLSFQNLFRGFVGFKAIKFLQIGDDMQSMRARIGMLPQTLGDAGDALDEVARRASASGIAIDAYGKLYSRIGNAAKDYIKTQEDLLGITDTISHALLVGGSSAAEASSVMLQFSQALGSGVLQGDEFRAMAEAAPQYLDKLAEAMNIPSEKLKKMASEGKLTSKAVIEATRSMSTYFRAEFEKMPMTVGRATTIVANKWKVMIDKINRESLFITKIASLIIIGLAGIENAIIILAEKFDGAGNLIQFALTGVATALLSKVIPAILSTQISLWAMVAPLLLLAAKFAILTLIVEDFYIFLIGGESVIGSVIGWLVDLTKTIFNAIPMMKGLLIGAGALIGVFGGLAAAAWAVNFAMSANPIAKIILSIMALGAAGVWLSGTWGTVFSWFGDRFSFLNDWVEKILKGLGKVGAAFGFSAPSTTSTSNVLGPGAPNVTPASLQGVGGGASSNNTINKNTTVNVTVPAGTSKEQAKFLQESAQKAFSVDNTNMTRDISMVSQ